MGKPAACRRIVDPGVRPAAGQPDDRRPWRGATGPGSQPPLRFPRGGLRGGENGGRDGEDFRRVVGAGSRRAGHADVGPTGGGVGFPLSQLALQPGRPDFPRPAAGGRRGRPGRPAGGCRGGGHRHGRNERSARGGRGAGDGPLDRRPGAPDPGRGRGRTAPADGQPGSPPWCGCGGGGGGHGGGLAQRGRRPRRLSGDRRAHQRRLRGQLRRIGRAVGDVK